MLLDNLAEGTLGLITVCPANVDGPRLNSVGGMLGSQKQGVTEIGAIGQCNVLLELCSYLRAISLLKLFLCQMTKSYMD